MSQFNGVCFPAQSVSVLLALNSCPWYRDLLVAECGKGGGGMRMVTVGPVVLLGMRCTWGRWYE